MHDIRKNFRCSNNSCRVSLFSWIFISSLINLVLFLGAVEFAGQKIKQEGDLVFGFLSIRTYKTLALCIGDVNQHFVGLPKY